MHRDKESIHDSGIERYLRDHCRGRDHAVKAAVIAEVFGMTVRDVAAVIRELRMRGVLIGSAKTDPVGYYIPADASEFKAYMDTYKSELFDMLRTYNIQKRALRAVQDAQGQSELCFAAGGRQEQLKFI